MAKILMKDGTEKKISLGYGDLSKIEKNNPELAKEYFDIQRKEELNELDIVKVIYIAYITTCEKEITFDEFCEQVVNNRAIMMKAYSDMIYPKN